MPCVFPILSLKALALSQQKQHSKRFQNALAYLSGVLSSFALVALMLYILRAKGEEIGWGFQLQSPIFVSVLLGLFIIIFLTMNDIIPLNGRFSGKLARYASLNHFATGFLAVVVATPCTGPFMGAAVGYALMQPEAASFVIFLSMGIGYALPMVIIELFPSAARRILPHSGQWSVRLKRFASVLIFLTCLWLAGVLLYQLKPLRNTEDTPWKPYQAELIDNLIQDGQPVLIDFTAKWCLTCLMNEQTTLKRQEFLDFAKRNHIALFKADWTNKDDAVSRALAHYGRQSVPLYVYYPPNMDGREIILPQILTLSDLMNRLKTDSTHHFDGTPHTLKILNPSN
jgi:thiol:disulfide interchange protein DsbD